MPSSSITSIFRSCVISPGRAPVYAQSHGTHRLAASVGLRVSMMLDAACRMIRASWGLKARVSRNFFFLGTVTLTSANGLRGTCLCSNAQRNTVLAALSQVFLTVAAERLGVIRLLVQASASSGIIEAALRSLKYSPSARNG